MEFKIDDTTVNDRTDWRHQLYPPVPQDRVDNSFPGVPQLIRVTGPAMPPTILVTGFAEGNDAGDLQAAILDLDAKLTDLANVANDQIHSITIHGHPFQNVVLDRPLETTTPIQRVATNDGSIKVIQGVRMFFKQLKFDSPG